MDEKVIKQFEDRINKIEAILGYNFKDKSNILSAITHRSFVAEYPEKIKDYEVLEFLGDAVLSLIVSEILIKQFPNAREGELSQLRSSIISEAYLSRLGRKISLTEIALVSKGELMQKGTERESLLCDVFEAIFGAIYVDCGYNISKPRAIFKKLFYKDLINDIKTGNIPRDYKSLLQIYTQKHFGIAPKYKLISEEGPEHSKIFTIECKISDKLTTSGKGKSKKEAETEAAKKAYIELHKTSNTET